MRRSIFKPVAVAVSIIAISVLAAYAQAPQKAKPPRAKPPTWPDHVMKAFFPDARKKLVGERPAYSKAGPTVAATSGGPSVAPTDSASAAGGGSGWSKLISRETLEDEIKTLQKQVSENVTTPAKFKGGGFKVGRVQFSELALLFAIIAEYDGDVRWKAQAAGIRDQMARAGFNCKVGTDASYNEAKLRKDDLEQLIQGGTIKVPDAEVPAKWDKVTDRPPLMQRIEQAQQQGVAVWTANSGEFNKNNESLLREAELMAAVAEVIQKEGFEFADDETYLGFAKQMRDHSVEVIDAVKSKSADSARAASGKIDKACSSCHEGYRS